MPRRAVTAAQLWAWIQRNAEIVDGKLLCRQSMWRYLGSRGVEDPYERRLLRARLTRELEDQGLIVRKLPNSKRVYILR